MRFGVELGKSVAKTGANMLTGGIINGIMGLFGGSSKAEQRQYQHEKEMMALQTNTILKQQRSQWNMQKQ